MRDTNRPPPLQPRCRPQCIVCGKPLGKVTKRRIVCRKAVCRYRFKTRAKQFEGVAHNVTENPTKSTAPKTSPSAPLSSDRLAHNAPNPPTISTPKTAEKPGRAYRVVAGPALTPEQLRLATLGAAFGNCPFALDRKLNRKHSLEAERAEIEANGTFTEPDWREVISSGGVRCFVALDLSAPTIDLFEEPAISPSDTGERDA